MFPDSLKTFQPIRSSRLASFSLHIYLQIYIYEQRALTFFTVFFTYEFEKGGWRREVY